MQTQQTQTEIKSTETLGPYTLIREVGRGGMSVVHQAVDRRTGKTVALKAHTVPPSLSSVERNAVMVRFAREARTVAGLSHPGIVAIHEVGVHDGTHFLAMEYLEGRTLHERLEDGPLTPAQAAPILSQVADAVDAVHAAGVVHRDIKPSNVMLLPGGEVKLLDFGVARKSEDTTVTATHSIVGSPTYMAPEQVQGELGDAASDVWALGVLLYEMLAGRAPFEGASIPSVLYKVVHSEPGPVPQVCAPVQRVLRHALEKDPPRRFPTARALACALQDALPASPPPDEAGDARGWRRWGPWAAVLAVGAALGIGLVMPHHEPPPAPTHGGDLLPLPTSAPPAPLPMPSLPRVHHSRRRRHAARPQSHLGARHREPTTDAAPLPRQKRSHRSAAPTNRAHRRPAEARPPAPEPMPLRLPLVQHPPLKKHPPPPPLRVRPEAMPRPEVRQAPAARPPTPRDDKDSDAQRTHDLEKFIWSEGR